MLESVREKLKALRPEQFRSSLPALRRKLPTPPLNFGFAIPPGLDPDLWLQRWMASLIELAKLRYPMNAGAQWQPGKPLKVLLAGYSGVRNTGSDVRVTELVRQLEHLLAGTNAQISVLTIDPEGSRGYFAGAKQVHLPQVFPKFLFDTVREQHAVIACEGSMFKSQFANALSVMMGGALGLALAEHKPAIGYGGEAGAMDAELEQFVRRYCREALVLARTRPSLKRLAELGIAARLGTDTAWTFEPRDPRRGRQILEALGWDGTTPVLACCPVNPFWWPVKPDLVRGALNAVSGAFGDAHYSSIYFHRSGPEVTQKFDAYIRAFARAVNAFRREHRVFPVIVGMERLDLKACKALKLQLEGNAPIVTSDRHDIHEIVGLLRTASVIASSRYHALVTSMPAGPIPVGVTIDERIENLMGELGHPELFVRVDDSALENRIRGALQHAYVHAGSIRRDIRRVVVDNLERMGQMGMFLVDHLRRYYPELPIAADLGIKGNSWNHLPPLSPSLREMVRIQRGWN